MAIISLNQVFTEPLKSCSYNSMEQSLKNNGLAEGLYFF